MKLPTILWWKMHIRSFWKSRGKCPCHFPETLQCTWT